MKKSHPAGRRFVFGLLVILLWLGCVDFRVVADEVPNDKSAKYLKALQRRPSGGYLFDRFFNAWMDTGTIAGMETFLEKQGDAESPTTGQRLLLAWFFAKQGEDERAVDVFERALADDPDNGEAWLEKARIENRLLNTKQALADLDKAAATQPKAEIAIGISKLKGRLLSRSGKSGEALKVWKELAASHPDDDLLQEDLVDLLLTEGMIDEAVETMTALMNQTGDAWQKITRRLRLGDILQRAGKRKEAIKQYNTSLTASGRDSWLEREVLAQIEQMFRREDDILGLRKHLADLEKTEKGRVALMKRRANILAELNEKDEATKVFEEVLKLTPGDRGNREGFISLLGRLEKFEEAAEQAKALSDLYPEDSELTAQLAQHQNAAAQKEEARKSVLTYLEKSDQSEYAHLRSARLLERFKETEEAEKIYDQLIKAFPESVSAKETQAIFLYRMDQNEKAVDIWKSIAASGSGEDAIRAARALLQRNEVSVAYKILEVWQNEFRGDFQFLGLLASTALRVEKYEEALPIVEKRLALVEDAKELNEALKQFLIVLDRLKQKEERLALLKDKPADQRSLTETCLLAEMLERNGDFDESEAVLSAMIEKGEILAMAQQVRLLKSRHEWEKAAEIQLRIVNTPEGRKSDNVSHLAEYYGKAMNFESALKWIEEWKKLSPGATQPWKTQSGILNQDGKSEEAIRVVRSAVQRFDDDTSLRQHLASLYQGAGKMADASRIYWTLYEDTEEIGSKISWVERLTSVAKAEGRLQKLIDKFDERRRNNRTSIIPLLSLAEIYRRDDDYEKRREMLLEVTRMRPEDVDLLKMIARVEVEQGNWEQGRETLRLALPLDKTDSTRMRLNMLELRYGDEELAYRQIEKMMGGNEMDVDTVLGMADMMILRSGWERADEFLERHAPRFTDDYRVAYLQAVTYTEAGNPEAAREIFLQLLDWENELAKPTGPSMVHIFQGLYGKDKDWLPPGVEDLVMWMSYGYRVFEYRNTLRNGRPRNTTISTNMKGGLIVPLPGSLITVKNWGIMHLLGIARTMDESELGELATTMQDRGVKNPGILLQIPFAEQPYNIQGDLPSELLDDYPDQQTKVAALITIWQQWVFRRSRVGKTAVDIDLMKRCYPILLEAGYPDLALTAAAYAATTSSEEGIEFFQMALKETEGKLLETQASSLSFVISQLAGGTSPLQVQSNSLPRDLKYDLANLLTKWRESSLKDKDVQKRLKDFTSFSPWGGHGQYLINLDTYDRFSDYLADEVSRFETMRSNPSAYTGRPVSGTMAGQFSWLASNRRLITELEFPPAFLPDFPANAAIYFIPIPEYGSNNASLDQEKAGAQIDRLKDPVLKILFANAAGDHDRVEKEIEAILTDQEKTGRIDLKTGLLAAAFFGKIKEDPQRAITLLEGIRHHKMDAILRNRIDSALVAYAMVSDERKEDNPIFLAGKNAVLRLRYGRLSPSKRSEVVDALTQLGLESEAGQLEKKATAAMAQSTTSRSTATAPRDLSGRIRKMMSDDKQEQAAKLSAQTIRATVKLISTSRNSKVDLDYQLLNFIRYMNGAGDLKNAVTKQFKPSPRRSCNECAKSNRLCNLPGTDRRL